MSVLKEFFGATFILATLTALFYASGINFIGDYLTVWDTDSMIINSSFNDVLYAGSQLCLSLGIYAVLLVAFWGALVLGLMYMVSDLATLPMVQRLAKYSKKNVAENSGPDFLAQEKSISGSRFSLILTTTKIVVSTSLVIMLIFWAYSKAINFAKDSGRDRALEKKEELISNVDSNEYQMIQFKEETLEAYIIANDGKLIALFMRPKGKNQGYTLIRQVKDIVSIKPLGH